MWDKPEYAYMVGIESRYYNIVNAVDSRIYASLNSALFNTVKSFSYSSRLPFTYSYSEWMNAVNNKNLSLFGQIGFVIAIFDKRELPILYQKLTTQEIGEDEHLVVVSKGSGYQSTFPKDGVFRLSKSSTVNVLHVSSINTQSFYQNLFKPDYSVDSQSHVQRLLNDADLIHLPGGLGFSYNPNINYYFNALDSDEFISGLERFKSVRDSFYFKQKHGLLKDKSDDDSDSKNFLVNLDFGPLFKEFKDENPDNNDD